MPGGSPRRTASASTAAGTRTAAATRWCGRGARRWTRPSWTSATRHRSTPPSPWSAGRSNGGSPARARYSPRLAERSRHRHRAALELVLSDVASGAESALEIRYLNDVERAHGLPAGRRQEPADRTGAAALRLRDVAYPDQRVVVELDGRLGHEQPADRLRDGRRDRDSAVDGWLTLRAFWADVTPSPCALATDVAAVLRGGWLGRPHRCRRSGCDAGRPHL